MRAATMAWSAMCPSSTNILVPLSFSRASPSAVAVASMLASSHRPLGSVKARVAIASPEAMPGGCPWRLVAEWSTALAASTTDEK